jgi:MoaA/NifB/PqqE/SkfB family radical SAM enzyme
MQPQLKDNLNYLSKLTLRKGFNAAQVLNSYYQSKISKKTVHQGLPISIAIEPTTSCNLRCPECPSRLSSFSRPTGMLQEDLFKKIIYELHATLTYLTYYFQGEPYLHPTFLNWVD